MYEVYNINTKYFYVGFIRKEKNTLLSSMSQNKYDNAPDGRWKILSYDTASY